jgi:hypothetical protein
MDEDIGASMGSAECARYANRAEPAPERWRRISARRKLEAVLRSLRGEDLELISRELGVTAAELSGWRDALLAGGEASLEGRPGDVRDAEIGRLRAEIDDLMRANRLLEAKIERLGGSSPLDLQEVEAMSRQVSPSTNRAGSCRVSGWWRDQVTKAATREPSRALPRRRALCTNWKKPR